MLVGGILYLVEPMVLYLVSCLNRALDIKAQLNCPHIHFIIEEECDSFTRRLVWMEVLTRGAEVCRKNGTCVISYSDCSKSLDTITQEDIKFFTKLQKQLSKKMEGIEVIDEAVGR